MVKPLAHRVDNLRKRQVLDVFLLNQLVHLSILANQLEMTENKIE